MILGYIISAKVKESLKTEGFDLKFISDQWGHVNIAFSSMAGRRGSAFGAVKALLNFVGESDSSLEAFHRSTHQHAFAKPDDAEVKDVCIIATGLLSCAQSSRVIESLTPPSIDRRGSVGFQQELIKSLYMIDRAVAELKGLGQGGPLTELANPEVLHQIAAYITSKDYKVS